MAVAEDRWHDGETFNQWWAHYDRWGNQPANEAIELVPDGRANRCRQHLEKVDVPDYLADLLRRSGPVPGEVIHL